ncbi:hypothetical protein AB0B63_18540 [Micromonospora sp. NPDC049081]|uniref:hypothetical protein n=1 Tax=Micromonospora sp. NPDC049081 TaxID=3155150 RepID=UPI003405C8D1
MTAAMPEPPDRAIVGLFDPTGRALPIVLERDDTEDAKLGEVDHWFSVDGNLIYTWRQVLGLAARDGLRVVRLYRADDPAVTGAFNAGVEAAVALLEQFAESCKGVEYDGMWADVIGEARRAVRS